MTESKGDERLTALLEALNRLPVTDILESFASQPGPAGDRSSDPEFSIFLKFAQNRHGWMSLAMVQFCLERLTADGATGKVVLWPKLIAEEPGEPGPVGFVLQGREGTDPDRLALYLNQLCDVLAQADSSEDPKKWIVH